MLKTAETLAMNYPVAITYKFGANRAGVNGIFPTACFCTQGCIGRKRLTFPLFNYTSVVRHCFLLTEK